VDNLASDSSQDPNPRPGASATHEDGGRSAWSVGGTPLQRRVPSSLGRRTRDVDNLSSEASQDPNPHHKRLRLGVESSSLGVPSSPPSTARTEGSASLDMPDGSSETRRGRKFWKREYIPVHNIIVFDITRLYLQAEVLSCHPWPNTATIENMISRTWIRAIQTRETERREIYEGSRYASAEKGSTKEPDEIAREIVSTSESELSMVNNNVRLTFSAETTG
jgi:hypothetical protein